MEITRLDHFVITVSDLSATCEFYNRVLGMTVKHEKHRPTSLHFGQQKINVHEKGKEFSPRSHVPTVGAADFCIITELPMTKLVEHLKSENVEIEVGPVPRTGAIGKMNSVYFRDPDNNLIEVSNYV